MDRITLLEMELVGHIGVDAGLCWIGDPCYILHKTKEEMKKLENRIGKNWSDFCNKISGNHTQFNYALGHAGLGVCVSTGYGDGTYPVYAKIRDNRVMGIYIDFDDLMGEEDDRNEGNEDVQ